MKIVNRDNNRRTTSHSNNLLTIERSARRIMVSPKALRTFTAVALLTLLVGASVVFSTVNAQTSADIVAWRTEQPFTLDGIPSETFWGQIQAVSVPLVGTTPWGGNIAQMTVKAAHDGTNLYLLLQWADGIESRTGDRAQRLEVSEPGNLIGRYHYNETYKYVDAASVTWWMGSDEPTVSPAINNEFGGSPTRQTTLFGWPESASAEAWMWKSGALGAGNPYWPDAGIDAGQTTWHWGDDAGQLYTMPHSAAYQALWNNDGMMVFGDGLLHAEGCQLPGTNPFDVHARGVWSSGQWTLELARAIASTPENKPYTVNFEVGETYHVVVGAFDGNKGEWEEVGSTSSWLSLELSGDLVTLEKAAQESLAAANEASKLAEDVQQAADNAQQAADNALQTSEDAQSAAESTTTLAYAAIGLAAVAIAIAAIMGVKKR